MAVTPKAKAAYDRVKKLKKVKEYYETAKKLIDEDTRDGELFKQGIKAMMKLGEKVVGTSLSSHPYFKFHKVHLEALAGALNASAMHEKAMDSLKVAIEAADGAEALAKSLEDFGHRKNALKLVYAVKLLPYLQTQRDISAGNREVLAEFQSAGGTQSQLDSTIGNNLYEFRAVAAELYVDAADLLAMVELEARAAAEAHRRYTEKVKKLQESKKSIDRVAGYGAEYKRQLEWAEREMDRAFNRGSNTPDPTAVSDPTVHARRQRDKVQAVVETLEIFCSAAMGDEAMDPIKFNLRVGTL